MIGRFLLLQRAVDRLCKQAPQLTVVAAEHRGESIVLGKGATLVGRWVAAHTVVGRQQVLS